MNIEAKNLSKIYGDGENRVVALDHAGLEFVTVYDAFTRNEPNSESERIYVVARECQKNQVSK